MGYSPSSQILKHLGIEFNRPCQTRRPKLHKYPLQYSKCPWCGVMAKETEWYPTEGLDPSLWEFACPRGHTFYQIVIRGETIEREDK